MKIQKGYYIKARVIQESYISKCPPHIREIWDWLLKEANHKDNPKLGIKRGELVRTYDDIIEGLSWFVGYRKHKYTKHQCEIALKVLLREGMITKAKTTRGLKISIVNYGYYQNPANYECHNENVTSATRKPQPLATINKNVKNVKNVINISSVEDEGWNFSFQLSEMLNGKRQDMQIIALYIKAQGFVVENKTQLSSIIKRNLRAASLLVGYSNPDIIATMEKLRRTADFKWTLETVSKYIDDQKSQNLKIKREVDELLEKGEKI